jgi:pyrroloquinoline quinone biosynthesis protein B
LPRGSAIAGCVLTDAELDHTAGLLLLREGNPFHVFCTATVRRWLNRFFPVEPILSVFSAPRWTDLPLEKLGALPLADGSPSGLQVTCFELDPHVPRFVRDENQSGAGSVIGLVVEDIRTGGRLIHAPCVGSIGTALAAAASHADCILLDGTFWDDGEPFHCGIGTRTARQMGHIPVSGPEGSLGWLSGLGARHRVYIHINNTNPMLDERGPEHRQVAEAGVQVGADGDQFEL